MKLRLWPRNWAPPWFAWSCLILQLHTAREEFTEMESEFEFINPGDYKTYLGEFTRPGSYRTYRVSQPRRVPFGFTPGATTMQITLILQDRWEDQRVPFGFTQTTPI